MSKHPEKIQYRGAVYKRASDGTIDEAIASLRTLQQALRSGYVDLGGAPAAYEIREYIQELPGDRTFLYGLAAVITEVVRQARPEGSERPLG